MPIAHVSGHLDVTPAEFALHYEHALEAALAAGWSFVVGDARGADALALEWLLARGAAVTVFHMHDSPRPQASAGRLWASGARFPTRGGFTSDEERDAAMTAASTHDIAWVRPGREASGTARNLRCRAFPAVAVERLGPDGWRRLRSLRLTALAQAPDAFAATSGQESAEPDAFWRARVGRGDVHQFVAVAGRDVGRAVVGGWPADPDGAGLYAVWVDPTARGHGVGDALLAAAIDAARALGRRRLWLDVGDDNAPAVALYARAGFVATGRTGSLPPPREHVREHERVREL